jgi:hypothetical protein
MVLETASEESVRFGAVSRVAGGVGYIQHPARGCATRPIEVAA